MLNGLTGSVAAHTISEDVYLTCDQVRSLKASLARVQELNRRLRLKIAYAWTIDVEEYYSKRQASPSCRCDLPYSPLDVHTDGHLAVCVSGKRVGHAGQDSIASVWHGKQIASYRETYERNKPMPMCFRCCGLSQSIQFD